MNEPLGIIEQRNELLIPRSYFGGKPLDDILMAVAEASYNRARIKGDYWNDPPEIPFDKSNIDSLFRTKKAFFTSNKVVGILMYEVQGRECNTDFWLDKKGYHLNLKFFNERIPIGTQEDDGRAAYRMLEDAKRLLEGR